MTKAKKTKVKSVPKLGVYVPENRAADIDQYRDRMNFSAIFWSAFDQEKYRLDEIQKRKVAFSQFPFHRADPAHS